jgi:hypothetical protein
MPTLKPTTLAVGEEGTSATYGEETSTTDAIGEEDPTTSAPVGEEGPFYPEYQTDNPFGSY